MFLRLLQLFSAIAIPVALVFATIALVGCDQLGDRAAETVPDDGTLDAANDARVDLGMAPLTRDADLDFAAQAHAEYLLLHRDLYGPVGLSPRTQRVDLPAYLAETPRERAAAAGFAGAWRSELIIRGDGQTGVDPALHPQLLDPALDSVGVGVARDGDVAVRVVELAVN